MGTPLIAVGLAAAIMSASRFLDAGTLDHLLNAYARTIAGVGDAGDDGDAASLAAYAQGVVDSGNGRLFCIDAEIDLTRIAAVTKRELDLDRAQRGLPASTLIGLALSKSFPCRHSAPRNTKP